MSLSAAAMAPLVPSGLRKLRWWLKTYPTPSRVATALIESVEAEAPTVEKLCDPAQISIDVGANLGGYTELLRRHSSRVVAFEANPDLARSLRWMMVHRRRVSVQQVALSDGIGTATLRVPVDHGRATLHSENNIGGRAAREISVAVCDLDSFDFKGVGFLKIDVEGHELAVLRGARRTLLRSQPALLVEATDEHRPNAMRTMSDYLAGLGYEGWFLDNGSWLSAAALTPEHRQQNFIFLHVADVARRRVLSSENC